MSEEKKSTISPEELASAFDTGFVKTMQQLCKKSKDLIGDELKEDGFQLQLTVLFNEYEKELKMQDLIDEHKVFFNLQPFNYKTEEVSEVQGE